MPKNMASKGGGSRKNMVCKGGSPKNAFKFSSDSIYNNASISARRPRIAFLTTVLKIQLFLGENAPRPPYFIIHPTATLPHELFHYKMGDSRKYPYPTTGGFFI